MSHEEGRLPRSDVRPVRAAGVWILAGQLGFIVATQFHAGGDANDHRAIFVTYAQNEVWGLVHALQFLATGVVTAGLVVLCSSMRNGPDLGVWSARVGEAFAVASLAIYGALQAVDGVGNKQVDQAWVAAEGAQRSLRFASAEAMRWLEWGVSSYYSFAAGLALLFVAAAMGIAQPVRASRAIALVIALSGVAMVVRGCIAGSQGFTSAHSSLIVTTWVLNLLWATWLVRSTRRELSTP